MSTVSSVQVAESDPAGEVVAVLCLDGVDTLFRMTSRVALELSSRLERVAGAICEREWAGKPVRTHFVGEVVSGECSVLSGENAALPVGSDAIDVDARRGAPSARELMAGAMEEDEDMKLGVRGVERLRNEFGLGVDEELPGPPRRARR